MRATTIVSLAVKHVGEAGSGIECWTGTFADCVSHLAAYLGPISMKGRFDLCLARSEEEARKGLMIGRKEKSQRLATEELCLDSLQKLMDEAAEGAVPDSRISIEELEAQVEE